jgi:hypothetical protein
VIWPKAGAQYRWISFVNTKEAQDRKIKIASVGALWVKGEDTWRLRYGELRGVPLAQWPAEATG